MTQFFPLMTVGVEAIGATAVRFRTNQYLSHGQMRPGHIFIVRQGWVTRYRQLRDGRRQITGLLFRDDCCDIMWLAGGPQMQTYKAVTEVEAVAIPRERLLAHLAHFRQGMAALANELALQSAISAEHALILGRKTAAERLAHLFAEIWWRSQSVNNAPPNDWPMPLTQQDIADFTGLTPIHVNRVLKTLRDSGIVTIRARRIVVPDIGRLQRLAQFDPRYLQGLGELRLHQFFGR